MCGILGMVSQNKNVAKSLYIGLYALQHRGKESAGITTSDGKNYYHYSDMGEVGFVFRGDVLNSLLGSCGIAQNRYSTAGRSNYQNTQPIRGYFHGEEFWLAHNGNLVNSDNLKKYCLAKQYFTAADVISDTRVIVALIALSKASSFVEALTEVFTRLHGAFSIVVLYKEDIIVIRDSFGFRPLHIGQKDNDFIVASETCVFDHLGASEIREVRPGEISIIDKYGIQEYFQAEETNRKFCIFEFIYFLRPDSKVFGRRVYKTREKMGQFLAQECPAEADLVIPIPDSGKYAGIGFIRESKLGDGSEALFRPHTVSRTFIEPVQTLREQGVELKFNIISEEVAGKKVVTVDDSVVRGTTEKRMALRLRKAGALEVHHRVSSPPYRWPCYYGIDTYRIKGELVAARHHGDISKVKEEMGLDSLGYLKLEKVIKAIIETNGKSLNENDFCTACFTGRYPLKLA
mgnify:CR=1 FL=1